MTRNQIQPVNNHNNNHQLSQRLRSRSLWSQLWMVILQPSVFFRTLPLLTETRQWLWIGILILTAVGLSAVRLAEQTAPATTNLQPFFDSSDFPGVDLGLGGDGGFETPLPNTNNGSIVPNSSSDVNANWTTALIAASGVILGWLILSLLLCEVSLFNGKAPRLGANFQIAVWASVPIGLMAILQLIYLSAGGQSGQPGLSGLLAEWPVYQEMPVFLKSLMLSLASRFTLFWMWSLILLYTGARGVLTGRWWASLLVVLIWVVVLVVMPVVTQDIRAPEPAATLPELIAPGFGEQGLGDDGSLPFDLNSDVPPFMQNRDAPEEPLPADNPFIAAPEDTPEATAEAN